MTILLIIIIIIILLLLLLLLFIIRFTVGKVVKFGESGRNVFYIRKK